MRKGSLPGEADSWNETWLIQESGVVGADGYIRTTSPPFPGVTESGTYTIGLLPAGMPSVSSIVKTGTQANSGLINLSTNLNFENSYLGAKTSGIGAVSATENQFEATTSLLAYLAQSSNKPLEIIGIPKVGETVVTTAQVQLNTQGVPTVSAVLNGPDTGLAVPLEPPSLESAQLEFSNSEPVIFLTGSNFLNGLNGNLGASFGDLKVDFKVSGKSYSGTVVPGLSSSLGENRYKVAIKAPISVPLGESEIVLSRPQKERFGPGPLDSDVVKRSSFEDIQLKPVFSDLILVAQRNSDKIQVIDALSSVQSPPDSQQKPPKDLSVGTSSVTDRPGLLAVTSNATRAYVPLEYTGRVAMVDLLARRPVDADASTATVDDINLPSGASPGAISIDPWDNYAYISDSKRGSIYVLDVNPDSPSYNQVVQTIPVNATSGLRQIAISSDGRKLFATAADGYIYAVNIDPEDKPSVPNSNPRKWWEQIGKVLTPTGAWGLAATPDQLKMVFTNGNPNTDGSGFGVLTVKDDPLNWAPTTLYTNLTLTNNTNVFEVNEGVAVTMTADGKYAFVAGRNSKKILEPNANPLAGGNIGIIQDPLGPNPKLVAATEPVPGVLTNNVTLSGDGKYLIGSYPTLGGGGSAYVFDVEEIIKTVENPAYALKTRAVEKFNPNIIPNGNIPAVIAIGGNPLGLIAAAPDDPCLTLIEKIIALGKELKKRFDDLRLDDQDLFNRRYEITDPPVPRIPPLSGRRTTVTGDPGSWKGHIKKYNEVKDDLKKLLKEREEMDNCDDYDPDGYGGSTMQDAYDQALEYSQKQPPKEPDIRNRSSLLARANELGAQVRDGALWVAAGVGGAVLIALEVIARLLGLDLRFRP
ncbi:MAG TPA: hypothetical protein DGO89_10415 [Microcoleaceae bacterium UBA9251]|jgi:Uncharacterized conserved protein|nr:hypothetical protein [Microcoleaceae cyanobacterium UBA9251]